MEKVSIIFKDKPKQWGFRGDSYFWEYLEEKFSEYGFPLGYDEFEKIVKEEHLKLTGVELTRESIGVCTRRNVFWGYLWRILECGSFVIIKN